MKRNIRLNQQATLRIIDDLIRAGFIKRSILRDGESRSPKSKSLRVDMTKKGTMMVASYADALRSISKPTNRKIEVFNALLVTQALDYMREVGWMEE